MIDKTPSWMTTTMQLAAIYNIAWGTWVVLFPQHFWELVDMPPMQYPMVWQGMGMIVGVYGVGYWLASYDPMRHWPIIVVGMLGKVFGPLGFIINYLTGVVPLGFFYTLITNDFIWWIPFGLILWRVHSVYRWKIS